MPDKQSATNAGAQKMGKCSTPNYYDLLGVTPGDTAQRLRQAHRDLSKLYHPDTTGFPAEEARLRFEQVQKAYEVLSDRAQRLQYDLQIGAIAPPKSMIPQRPERVEIESSAYLSAEDRPLSSGEVFSLFILGVTFLGCLVLALALGLARGEALMPTPSWQTTAPIPSAERKNPEIKFNQPEFSQPGFNQAGLISKAQPSDCPPVNNSQVEQSSSNFAI